MNSKIEREEKEEFYPSPEQHIAEQPPVRLTSTLTAPPTPTTL